MYHALGIAWRPPDLSKNMTSVVRAGYGIFQLFTDFNNINNELASVPFIASATVLNNAPPAVPQLTLGELLPRSAQCPP